MPSESGTVAVVLYGTLGDWDRAEIVHKNAATRPTDEEYAKLCVVARDAAMDVIDDHGIDDVDVVRPTEGQ